MRSSVLGWRTVILAVLALAASMAVCDMLLLADDQHAPTVQYSSDR